MNEYLVSARKYRPKSFEDVVGQKHVTTTLHNVILNNTIAHAYLFCGPRGVGKTTCARIFAKAVNKDTDSEYNIFELDAASNNGVDHIRNLIEQIKIPPQVGKYKIYIIDEVHMLSDAAFNAFLKTLEEPPKHSIFILATTEKNKLIPTILSRCQIFDFQKISVDDIQNHLLMIVNEQNITVNTSSIKLIAEKADGSLRDALSTFDKVYAYCNDNWEHKKVLEILSVLDTDFTIKLTNTIIDKSITEALLEIHQVLDGGFSPKEVIIVLITHFRNLIIVKDPKTSNLISLSDDLIQELKSQSEQFSNQQLLSILTCLNETEQLYNKSIHKRFLVELCVMQLCSIEEMQEKKKILIDDPKKKTTENKKPKTDTLNNCDSNETNDTQKSHSNETNDTQKSRENLNKEKSNNLQNSSTIISITDELTETSTITKKGNSQNSNSIWSEEKMLDLWKKFAIQLKKTKKINAYNIFNRHFPKKENNSIILEVVSLSEKTEIEEFQIELLHFFKKELQNDYISLLIQVSLNNQKNVLYTKEDKYKYILEKNEHVQLLQKKLNLTIN